MQRRPRGQRRRRRCADGDARALRGLHLRVVRRHRQLDLSSDVADDICKTDLDVTVVEADGALTVEAFEPAADAPIDCFYVYPTISRDEADNSDLDWSLTEEGVAVRNQAARLGEVCDVYAPVYRQRTLTALLAGLGGSGTATDGPDPRELAYADVLDAWKHYMANDNGGRGVVLVGHSQGNSMLSRLMAEEVDPNEDVRDLLVSAYLAGGSVEVPEGEVVGGEFLDIPLCESEDQFGCVVTWSSFRATAPPPDDTFYGVASGDDVAGCVNPAGVEGGRVALDPVFSSMLGASILSQEINPDAPAWVDPSVGEITTLFVRVPGLVEGECRSENGVNWLEVTVNADPDGPRHDDIPGDLTPEWGLHLVDVSLVMGDVVDLVAHQSDAWIAAR